MKKITKSSIISFIYIFLYGVEAKAGSKVGEIVTNSLNHTANGTGHKTETNIADVNIYQTIGKGIGIALSLTGVMFLGLLIYGGVKWMKSSGREQDIQSAQKIIQAAIIGIVIVFSAYAITAYLGNQLIGTVAVP